MRQQVSRCRKSPSPHACHHSGLGFRVSGFGSLVSWVSGLGASACWGWFIILGCLPGPLNRGPESESLYMPFEIQGANTSEPFKAKGPSLRSDPRQGLLGGWQKIFRHHV